MGSWDVTCLVTRLPICAGEPVVVFVMEQSALDYTMQRSIHGPHDPMGLWIPICLPLRGEYDGYGWIENVIENGGATTLRNWLMTPKRGEGRIALTLEQAYDMDLDGFSTFLTNQNEARIGNPALKDPKLGVAFIHAEVFDALVREGANGDLAGAPARRGVDEFVAYYEGLREEERRLATSGDARASIRLERKFHADEIEDKRFPNAIFVSQLFRRGSEKLSRSVKDYLINASINPAFQQVCDDLAAFIVFRDVMLFSRMSLFPNGMGSQDRDTTYQSFIARMTLEMITERESDETDYSDE